MLCFLICVWKIFIPATYVKEFCLYSIVSEKIMKNFKESDTTNLYFKYSFVLMDLKGMDNS